MMLSPVRATGRTREGHNVFPNTNPMGLLIATAQTCQEPDFKGDTMSRTNSVSRRSRLTYANVASTLALMLAVGGGSAYAASHFISGSQITPGSITARQIKVHSLVGADFKAGQLPRGPQGASGGQGPQGAQGPQGPAGTAVAWGFVTVNQAGNPFFAGQSGFPGSVTEPQAGVFCIAPPPGYLNRPLLLTEGGSTDTVPREISNQQCGGNQFEVEASSSLQPGEGFNVAVP